MIGHNPHRIPSKDRPSLCRAVFMNPLRSSRLESGLRSIEMKVLISKPVSIHIFWDRIARHQTWLVARPFEGLRVSVDATGCGECRTRGNSDRDGPMAIPVDAARRVAKGNSGRAWLLRGARKDNSRCTLSARPVWKARVCIEPPAVPGQTLTEPCVAGHNHCQVKHVERGPHPEKMPAVHDWKVVSPESRVDVRIVLLSSHEGLRSNILSDMPFRKRKVLWFLP